MIQLHKWSEVGLGFGITSEGLSQARVCAVALAKHAPVAQQSALADGLHRVQLHVLQVEHQLDPAVGAGAERPHEDVLPVEYGRPATRPPHAQHTRALRTTPAVLLEGRDGHVRVQAFDGDQPQTMWLHVPGPSVHHFGVTETRQTTPVTLVCHVQYAAA